MSNESNFEKIRSNKAGILTMQLFQNNRVVYDFNDMVLNFTNFTTSLGILKDLEVGDKLGVNEKDKLYIDKNSRFQHIRRWYYNQDRDKSMLHLTNLMSEYFILIEMIISSIRNTNKLMLRINGDNFINFLIKVIELNNKCCEGLKVLCKTYEHDEEYVFGLDNLIEKLSKKNKILRFSIVV